MKKQTENKYILWIDKIQKIVSFKAIEGFEVIYFSNRQQKYDYADLMCAAGYRIQ
ncbi:MAG: hypothetical protein IJ356_05045 [Erysipelotrichaceae bacterium]|nr:hypothetical protein [Erysipelotrichaceae bacterium]